ncbi:MAG: type II secretion system F family protein [Alphaproteobacteria bacterium]|jgi:type II secretory pathway component PulF|nr:type II secretion system F family protein [Alphaproteobacteria bacterium]
MPNFGYYALTKEGIKQKGWATVQDETSLRRVLSDQNLTLIRHWHALPQWCQGRRVKDTDRQELFAHLAALHHAGFPLEEAFEHYQGSPYTVWLCREIARSLCQGHTLTAALTPFSDMFDRTCFCILSAAQTPTQMSDALTHLAEHFEWRTRTKQEVVKSLIYPLCLLSVVTFLIGFLMTQVVPQMEQFLALSGTEPALSAQILKEVCTVIEQFGGHFLGIISFIIVVLIVGVRYVPDIRMRTERAVRQIPVVGALWHENQVRVFLHSLCLMLRAGVSLLDALKEATTSQKTAFQKDMQALIHKVSQGSSLAHAMEQSRLFPKEAVRLCALGEKAGSLERYLSRASSLISHRFQHKTQKFLALLEPCSLVFVGGLLVWIVSSVFVPLYEHITLLERTS